MRIKDVFGVYPFHVGCQEAWVLHDGFLWGEPIQQYAVGLPDPEETELLPGVHSVPLPGHTPGQSGYLFQSEESRFLVAGSAMHDAVLHVERPEWTSMGDARRQKTVDTRLKVLTRLANERLRFHTYHFPFPGIGYIRKNGEDGFEFEPERWTWI
jgi:glyoxylase-like metal-dependent hydrolase (beta-lactamase superfamily II)